MLFGLLFIQTAFGQEMSPPRNYGGTMGASELIQAELDYPKEALDAGLKGKVMLFFVVREDGSIGDIKVWKSAGEELDAEAHRLLNQMLWIPAYYKGEPMSSEHLMTFHFSPKKFQRICKRRGYEKPPFPYSPVDSSGHVYESEEVDKAPKAVFDRPGMTVPQFLMENIHYPEAAFRGNIRGKVKLMLVVEPSGRTSNIRATKPLGGGCTSEAVRLAKLLKWQPAYKDGKAVRSKMKLEISFQLSEQSNYQYNPAGNRSSMQ